jgi:glycosyltransferase involved in cell wall biosynthesis
MLSGAVNLTKEPDRGAAGALRVLHVIPSVASFRGGPSQVIRMMAEGLAERGVAVEVATTDDDGPRRLAVPRGVPVREGRVTYWYFPRQIRPYICSVPLAGWLWRHVWDFDLVHIHTVFSYASTTAALMARARGVPYIVRPLGVLNRWGFANRKPFLKRVSFAAIDRQILKHAAAIQYTSVQERTEAERLCPGAHAVVVPNPVRISEKWGPPARRPESGVSSQPVILFMSRVDQKKGLDLLIEAFARVERRFPGSRLVVAGSGDAAFEKSLRRLAEKELVADAMDWVGFVSGAAKQAWLERAAVFVLPSYSENFGVAVAEAMAAGLPVIISDQIGIHPAVTQGGAGLVVPLNVAALADALTRVLADPAAGQVMGERGRRLAASEFSIPVVAEKLVALYQSVLGGSSSRKILHV